MQHSAGFKREQSRQRSTRITQTKSTTGKEKKAWNMQTEVGERESERERERERVLGLGPGWLAIVLLFALAAATVGFATFAKSVVCSRPPALCRFSVFIAVVISVFSFSFPVEVCRMYLSGVSILERWHPQVFFSFSCFLKFKCYIIRALIGYTFLFVEKLSKPPPPGPKD